MHRIITLSRGLALSLAFCGSVVARGIDLTAKPLGRIPAGTRFQQEPPVGWSNIVLFVEGRLGSGDTDAVSDTVAYYAKIFNLVMLANSQQDSNGNYFLDKVGVGFSMIIDGKNTIVTSDSHRKLNSGLSFIGGSVLSGNEDALADIEQVARTRTSMIIDAPTIMFMEGEHRQMICRYAIWAKPSSGGIGTAVWLLDDPGTQQGDYAVAEKVFQYLPANTREDRVLNVKKDRFTFGIPSKDAFALVRIPQGIPFKFTDEMRASAGARKLTAERYRHLWSSMSHAMQREPVARTAKAK
jgi:hypothetical protein